MKKFTKEIEALENAARHISNCALTAPTAAEGSALDLRAISLNGHAAVLRAADGDEFSAQNAGYDWQEPGRIERALRAAATL